MQEHLGYPETPLQTCSSQGRASSSHTFESDLQLYLQKQGSTPEGIPAKRDALVCNLRANPSGCEQWWEFLHHEETGAKRVICCILSSAIELLFVSGSPPKIATRHCRPNRHFSMDSAACAKNIFLGGRTSPNTIWSVFTPSVLLGTQTRSS